METGRGAGGYTAKTPKHAIASSRCCFNMSQSYAYALYGEAKGAIPWHRAFGYKSGKGTLTVKLEEKRGNFSLKNPITSEDYSEITCDYAYGEDSSISLDYPYWDNFIPGLDPDGNPFDPNRLDGSAYKNVEINSGNLPCVYLSFTAECSQEEMMRSAPLAPSLTSFHAYPEVTKEHSGYRNTDFMGQRAVVPIGGDYQSFKQGIFACRDGNPP